eukprot:CAMPEP_0170752806 /NCGR_PEP_ID=MMETSP0437-20130122/12159_1 /TAXON_ID=0 /ORGANISM="Sexangularia sp." /LENGTH=363 /DNA_ID=CAMNT_0011091889 /DNA_START=1 /DNA_END=1093 /DNA_ORIENTATION=+
MSTTIDESESRLTGGMKELADIWSAVLSLETLACRPDTTFIEVGGDSVSAIRLVGAIRHHYKGVAFSVRDVFDTMSLKAMSERLQRYDVADHVEIEELELSIDTSRARFSASTPGSRGRLTRVRKSHRSAAVVCFPGLGWMGGELEDLVGALSGCNVFLVQLHGEDNNLTELIERVADEVTELDYNDVILVGHSMGGLVASMVATEVSGRHREPVQVCMIDTHNVRARGDHAADIEDGEVDDNFLDKVIMATPGARERFTKHAKLMREWERSGEFEEARQCDVMIEAGAHDNGGRVSVAAERTYTVHGADHFSVLRRPFVANVAKVILATMEEEGKDEVPKKNRAFHVRRKHEDNSEKKNREE